MSSNNDSPTPFDKAVKWLGSLPAEQQFTLIVNTFSNPQSLQEQERIPLILMISEIRYLLNHNSKDEAVAYLQQKGLDNNIAVVLVDNVSKLGSTPKIDARSLHELDRDKFVEVINAILISYYLKGKSIEDLSQELNLGRGLLDSARRLISGCIFSNLRGNYPVEEIEGTFLNTYGLSEEKVKAFINLFQENIHRIREVLMFQAVSKVMDDMDTIKGSLAIMWKKLEDLSSGLKQYEKQSQSSDMYG